MVFNFRDDGLEFGDDGLEISRRISRLGYSFFDGKRLSQKCHGKFPYFFLDFGFYSSFCFKIKIINKIDKKLTKNKTGLYRTVLPIYMGATAGDQMRSEMIRVSFG